MKNPSILHIAPENTAGVPFSVMQMQNRFGMHSRLITFYKIPFDFPEDVCLHLKLPRSSAAMGWRKFKQSDLHKKLEKKSADKFTYMPYYRPHNVFESVYRSMRERSTGDVFKNALERLNTSEFGIVHFDGGIDFFSDSRTAKRFKSEGKKIINCYFGDDLRTRGIVKEMDELSDLNITFEYDHTLRHPDINFLFFPFDNSGINYIPEGEYENRKVLKIVHAPTNRIIKGTPEVLNAINEVKKHREIDFILLENLPREKVISEKSKCHIAIDQIGNRGGTGYGINSLETLSMGIPTITDMNCNFDTWLPENPFIVANKDNLSEKIIGIIDNLRKQSVRREKLRAWVEKYHSYESVFRELINLYKKYKITGEDFDSNGLKV